MLTWSTPPPPPPLLHHIITRPAHPALATWFRLVTIAHAYDPSRACAAYADFSTTARCAEYAADAEPATAVTFFVVALTLGLLAFHVLSFIPVPYTALLLVRRPVRVAARRLHAQCIHPMRHECCQPGATTGSSP